ncbi:gamma-interferon-inducible lysosomal thiol reductase [Pituophis catenifer annectens]|uniref:gamma-interferon-inducible lysosomal thiol reductase n=1 Tax=Pituophis catenifer annectens TaxID=94852 RepID=UPI003995DCC5
MAGWLLLLIAGSLWASSCGESNRPTCGYPPQLWCSSKEIAQACQVEKHCTRLISNTPKADPVSISLYYESLCPGCREFLVLMLFPTWLMLGDIMNITLVPYGNAEEKKEATKWHFECQHGEEECLGNMIEACISHLYPNFDFLLIFCMESSTDVVTSLPLCLKLYAPNASLADINACVNGDLGNKLMHRNAELTRALKPHHEYVPWILINGEHSEKLQTQAQESLFNLVCSLYKGDLPPACNRPKELSFLPFSPNHTFLRKSAPNLSEGEETVYQSAQGKAKESF